ncbi:hypothetical protein [Xanthomonas vasicola]|uniref:hypothetical protein n=1 Tax=Xanthomonas vasicola TaxID=56459 RepID=UPI0018785AAC|nr:hypothetical protein [Xanthomonas vasicola]
MCSYRLAEHAARVGVLLGHWLLWLRLLLLLLATVTSTFNLTHFSNFKLTHLS